MRHLKNVSGSVWLCCLPSNILPLTLPPTYRCRHNRTMSSCWSCFLIRPMLYPCLLYMGMLPALPSLTRESLVCSFAFISKSLCVFSCWSISILLLLIIVMSHCLSFSVPLPPSGNLKITDVTHSSMRLNWDPAPGKVTKYIITYRPEGGEPLEVIIHLTYSNMR